MEYGSMPLKSIAQLCNQLRKMTFRCSIDYDPQYGPQVILEDEEAFEEFFGEEITCYPTNCGEFQMMEVVFGGVMFKCLKKMEVSSETFRDRAAREFPGFVGSVFDGGVRGCPCDYGYEKESPSFCPKRSEHYLKAFMDCDDVCRRCWDREVPKEVNKA